MLEACIYDAGRTAFGRYGGVESMSRAPLVISKANHAYDRVQVLADSTMGARFTNPAIISRFGGHSLPETADNIAVDLGITRRQSDLFAATSQAKYEVARGNGFFKDERVNPNGGAIAIGHPLGASGARIVMTALCQLERTGGRYALAAMCIGIGQGIAAIIERL